MGKGRPAKGKTEGGKIKTPFIERAMRMDGGPLERRLAEQGVAPRRGGALASASARGLIRVQR